MSEKTNAEYRFTVTISGQDQQGSSKSEYTQAEPAGIDTVVVEDHVDLIGVAQMSFNLNQMGWDVFEIGNDVSITVGGNDRMIFKGVITGIRFNVRLGREAVTVIAMDPLCRFASSRRTAVYTEVSDSDIVSDVLGGDAGQVDSTSGTNDYVLQRNESDLDFLKRLAARNGRILMANEGSIDFVTPNFDGGSSAIELEPARVEVIDFTYSTAKVPTSVTCYGWDYVAKEMVEGTASSVQGSVGGGSDAVSETGVIWEDESYVSDVLVSNQDAAKAMAESELDRHARNFLRGRAVVEGNGEVYAGTTIKFSGFRTGFNATAFVVSSRHVIENGRGYKTEIQFCSNTMPE